MPSYEEIKLQPLTAEAFAPFGQVLDCSGQPTVIINAGLCQRFSDLVDVDIIDGAKGEVGQAGVSIFKSQLRSLPYKLDLLERHPLGSQAFLPLSHDGFLVIAAPDAGGTPGRPLAFLSQPGQGINFARNTWHGVLTPLSGSGLFAVVDRIGLGDNLEEAPLQAPYLIVE